MLNILTSSTRSKYGRRFLRRGIMNSKMGNKNFYKGRNSRNEGTHTTKGK